MGIKPLSAAEVMSALETLKANLMVDLKDDPETLARVLAGVEKDYRQFAATKA